MQINNIKKESLAVSPEDWIITCERTLREKFRYDFLREYQRRALKSFYAGENVIQIIGTGQGKSLCFQLPAVALGKVCVVISPLISLMENQVQQCQDKGISALYLKFGLNEMLCSKILQGDFSLVYMSPERAVTHEVLTLLRQQTDTEMQCQQAIDEAHCISEWGHSFRGEYSELSSVVHVCRTVPLLCLTATATNECVTDIQTLLDCHNLRTFRYSVNRDNLILSVREREHTDVAVLKEYMTPNMDLFVKAAKSGDNQQQSMSLRGQTLVYCSTRAQTEDVVQYLQSVVFTSGYPVKKESTMTPSTDDGYPYYSKTHEREFLSDGSYQLKVAGYHAGMAESIRSKVADQCFNGQQDVLVCTTAFGMGINLSNVRQVIHYGLPLNLDGYVQQIGRGGRDNLKCMCALIYSQRDIGLQKLILTGSSHGAADEELAKRIRQAKRMVDYVETTQCRQTFIKQYFHEDAAQACGFCDVCTGTVRVVDTNRVLKQDITLTCWLLLNIVLSSQEKLGQVKIVEMAMGSSSAQADKCVGFFGGAGVCGEKKLLSQRSILTQLEAQEFQCEKLNSNSAGSHRWISLGVGQKGRQWLQQVRHYFQKVQPPSMKGVHEPSIQEQPPFCTLQLPMDVRVYVEKEAKDDIDFHNISTPEEVLTRIFIECEHQFQTQHVNTKQTAFSPFWYEQQVKQHIGDEVPENLQQRQVWWTNIRTERLQREAELPTTPAVVKRKSLEMAADQDSFSFPNTREGRVLRDLVAYADNGKSIITFVATKSTPLPRIVQMLKDTLNLKGINHPIDRIVRASVPNEAVLSMITEAKSKQDFEQLLVCEGMGKQLVPLWDLFELYKIYLLNK